MEAIIRHVVNEIFRPGPYSCCYHVFPVPEAARLPYRNRASEGFPRVQEQFGMSPELGAMAKGIHGRGGDETDGDFQPRVGGSGWAVDGLAGHLETCLDVLLEAMGEAGWGVQRSREVQPEKTGPSRVGVKCSIPWAQESVQSSYSQPELAPGPARQSEGIPWPMVQTVPRDKFIGTMSSWMCTYECIRPNSRRLKKLTADSVTVAQAIFHAPG